MSKLSSEIISQKHDSFINQRNKRTLYDKLEKLFHGMVEDTISSKTKSQVNDPRLASLLIERSYRVMSQLGTGKVVGVGKNDRGDAKLKNLLLEKYVIPNANSQFDLLTKFRMVDLYSNIYGTFDALVDWNVKKNGYVGPDMWLLNKRDVFNEIGAVSIADSDQIIIRTWRPKSFFETLRGDKSYKNINKILELIDKKKGSKGGRDSENKSKREEDQYDNEAPDGFYEVLTRYERDRWVDVCADVDEEFRDQKNPHENDELPVVRKYSIPLLDDPDGLGDAERGSSMQQVQNSIWNLMLDGAKISMMPPILVNKDNIASMSSIKWGAAQKWLVRGQIDNAIRPLQVNPQNMSTFNSIFQATNASLLNVFGTSDTTVTSSQDAGFGKTPQALEMQQARENTRDNADRFYMEQFVSEVMKKMVNLLNKKQSSQISIRMFPEEIELLARDNPEIAESFDEESGKLTVPKGKKSMLYDYEIVSGSTYALDQKAQSENLAKIFEIWKTMQTPQGNILEAALEKSGFKFNFGELFKRLVVNTGTQDWDKILTELSEEEKTQGILEGDAAQFQQVLAQMTQGQGMNQVPPMPGEMGQQMPPEMGQQPML